MTMSINGHATRRAPAILTLNKKGQILYVSQPIEQLLGYDATSLTGTSGFDLLARQDAGRTRRRYELMVTRPGVDMSVVVQARHKAGHTVWLELTAVNLLENKTANAVVVCICPFAGKKRTEERTQALEIAAAREAERANLAAELHDNVNQIIGMTVVFVEAAMRDDQRRTQLLTETTRYLRSAADEIRKLSYTLAGNDLENFGLQRSVERLAEHMRSVLGARIVTRINPRVELLLLPEQKLHLLRIIQEQMQNILRHAKASRILLNLSVSREFVVLRIKDNGRGFDVNAVRAGIGITNMTQRAKALNGHFHIESEPGKGTSVMAYLPLANGGN